MRLAFYDVSAFCMRLIYRFPSVSSSLTLTWNSFALREVVVLKLAIPLVDGIQHRIPWCTVDSETPTVGQGVGGVLFREITGIINEAEHLGLVHGHRSGRSYTGQRGDEAESCQVYRVPGKWK